jgi:hypothetical protein
LRLAAGHEDLPGLGGQRRQRRQGSSTAPKRDFLRGKLLVKPSAGVEVTAMFFHTEADAENEFRLESRPHHCVVPRHADQGQD